MLARKVVENPKKNKQRHRSQEKIQIDFSVRLGQRVLVSDYGHDAQESQKNHSHRLDDRISKFVHRLYVVLKKVPFVFYKKHSLMIA